jgi:hypothetical protein
MGLAIVTKRLFPRELKLCETSAAVKLKIAALMDIKVINYAACNLIWIILR